MLNLILIILKNITNRENIMRLAIGISETDKGYTLPNPWVWVYNNR